MTPLSGEDSMRRSLTALLAFVALPVCAADTGPQPGHYEMATQMLLRGSSDVQPAVRYRECLKAEAFANGEAFRPSLKPGECTVSHYTVANNRASYDFACEVERTKMRGHGDGTLQPDGFALLLVGTLDKGDGENDFRMSLRGKRVGDCE